MPNNSFNSISNVLLNKAEELSQFLDKLKYRYLRKKVLVHNGDDGSYTRIEDYNKFIIYGRGEVTIEGPIGVGSKIIHCGTGDLLIHGPVKNNVTFKLTGTGDLIFSEAPPPSTIFQNFGTGKISIPRRSEDLLIKKEANSTYTNFAKNSLLFLSFISGRSKDNKKISIPRIIDDHAKVTCAKITDDDIAQTLDASSDYSCS